MVNLISGAAGKVPCWVSGNPGRVLSTLDPTVGIVPSSNLSGRSVSMSGLFQIKRLIARAKGSNLPLLYVRTTNKGLELKFEAIFQKSAENGVLIESKDMEFGLSEQANLNFSQKSSIWCPPCTYIRTPISLAG